MTSEDHREHLDHLPGRAFLVGLAAVSALAIAAGVIQLATADQTSARVLWSLTIGLGALSLLALGVAWEERRAHVHALVREALEGEGHGGADPVAELLRMGAHREVDYLRSRVTGPAREELP